jgi:hypothetical protein
MTRPLVRIYDLSTDDITDREMNDAEFAQYQIDVAAAAERIAAETAKAAEKDALLSRLGITADEAKLLLS